MSSGCCRAKGEGKGALPAARWVGGARPARRGVGGDGRRVLRGREDGECSQRSSVAAGITPAGEEATADEGCESGKSPSPPLPPIIGESIGDGNGDLLEHLHRRHSHFLSNGNGNRDLLEML
ncbi:hypothetical protein ACP70R_042942 [Stipagrostis hirtigluma subsp. patula]